MISAKRGGVGLFYSAIFFSERNPEMKRKKIGTMDFHGSVDITDPCYNRDVWCRMTDVKIRKGVYTCMVDHADFILAVWNGKPSGTGRTVTYARGKGRTVIVIDPVSLAVKRL